MEIGHLKHYERPLKNTQCIPACPVGPEDRTGVVKIIAFLELEKIISFSDGHYLCKSGWPLKKNIS
jgi:hypothetical protein